MMHGVFAGTDKRHAVVARIDVHEISSEWLVVKVSQTEAEQVFLNRPVVVTGARLGAETRWFALGRTDVNRLLTVVFTIRNPLLRVISARPMSRGERKRYVQTTIS